ncbi:MAG: branched-chain amino acid ABC transporter substrate-binding protein, partial [Gaiella sp.]
MARALLAGSIVAGLALVALGCAGAERSACAAVEFEGGGTPDLVLASSLPLQGGSGIEARQINEAISAELRTRGYRAGDHTVGFRSCDDSTAEAGGSEPGACSANANAFADDEDVIGVIGPLDSKCAAILVPVLGRASTGAIPVISPSNTDPCLTRAGGGCDASEPEKYYAAGVRNYFRVAASDIVQGAANAELARDAGVRRVAVLHDGEAEGIGLATYFRAAARSLGIEVVAFDAWNPEDTGYVRQLERIRAKRPDGVFLAGHVDRNGGQLIRDKVAVLGPNDGAVKLLASDGFAPAKTLAAAGVAAEGMS